MTSYVVLDTSFLVNAVVKNDPFHEDAALLFRRLGERKNIQIILPPLVIYETIVTLRRKGTDTKTVETVIMRLVNLSYVSVLSLSELSAFKHAAHALHMREQNLALRTNDFVIYCLGKEFDALIVTFDIGMYRKCKKVYPNIFFPAKKDDVDDDTALILLKIDGLSRD